MPRCWQENKEECKANRKEPVGVWKIDKSPLKSREQMWPTDKAIQEFYLRMQLGGFLLLELFQQPNLPLLPCRSVTFKVTHFPFFSITAADTPLREGEILAVCERHPTVLPCPFHGPAGWSLSGTCNPSKDVWLMWNWTVLRNKGQHSLWATSCESTVNEQIEMRTADMRHHRSLSSCLSFNTDLDNWQLRVLQSCMNTEEPHKHPSVFLKTVWKALLSTDRVRSNGYPRCASTRGGLSSQVCASIVPCVGAGGPWWPIQAEERTKCQWIINALFAARLRCTWEACTFWSVLAGNEIHLFQVRTRSWACWMMHLQW